MPNDFRYKVPPQYYAQAEEWVWRVGFWPSRWYRMNHTKDDQVYTVEDYVRSMHLDDDDYSEIYDGGPWGKNSDVDDDLEEARDDLDEYCRQEHLEPGDDPLYTYYDLDQTSDWFTLDPPAWQWGPAYYFLFDKPPRPQDQEKDYKKRVTAWQLRMAWSVTRCMAGMGFRYYHIIQLRNLLQIPPFGKGPGLSE